MGQLEVRAIDAELEGGWRALLLGMLRGASWELTCGFCKERFRRVTYFVLSSVVPVLRYSQRPPGQAEAQEAPSVLTFHSAPTPTAR